MLESPTRRRDQQDTGMACNGGGSQAAGKVKHLMVGIIASSFYRFAVCPNDLQPKFRYLETALAFPHTVI